MTVAPARVVVWPAVVQCRNRGFMTLSGKQDGIEDGVITGKITVTARLRAAVAV
jgi:hypothetical protein